MKKAVLFCMLTVCSITAFAQTWHQVSKSNLKNLLKLNQKQTRGTNERCVEINYYSDTSFNGMPVVLNEKSILSYSGNRKSKNIVFSNLIAYDVANDCDKSVKYYGLSSQSSDSTIVLSNYDNTDRKVFSATTIFNGSGFDTSEFTKLTYSGLNKIDDTSALYINNPLPQLVYLTVNKISNNNIDTTLEFYDAGTGFKMQNKNAFKYNAQGQIIEQQRINPNQFGMPTGKSVFVYNASDLYDSILEYNFVINNFVLTGTNKFYYDASNTNGRSYLWSATNVKIDGVRFLLNSDKLITMLESYSFNTPTDSSFESLEKMEFNTNGNLTKLINQSSIDGNLPIYVTNDSTIYTYKPFFPLAFVNNTKTISSLSCYPNPIQNMANFFYNSTAIKPMQIIISDAFGKIVYCNKLQSVNGNSFISVPMEHMQAGNYVCSIFVDGQIQESIKLQKQ
jgi:hypothetical protein